MLGESVPGPMILKSCKALPQEVRDEIFKYLLVNEDPIYVYRDDGLTYNGERMETSAMMLLRRFDSEPDLKRQAFDIFYRYNTFNVPHEVLHEFLAPREGYVPGETFDPKALVTQINVCVDSEDLRVPRTELKVLLSCPKLRAVNVDFILVERISCGYHISGSSVDTVSEPMLGRMKLGQDCKELMAKLGAGFTARDVEWWDEYGRESWGYSASPMDTAFASGSAE